MTAVVKIYRGNAFQSDKRDRKPEQKFNPELVR